MKNEMKEIDNLIKESLTQEEAKFYDDLEEQNLFAKLGGVAKGKQGWLAIVMTIDSLLFFGFMIYCVIQFYNTGDVQEQIQWVAGFFISLAVVSMIKVYIWMQMSKNDVLRELKRMELQLAAQSNKD